MSTRSFVNSRRCRVKGFTLIELLVVVAIIALLISVLLPSMSDAREQARRVKCGATLRGIGQGMYVCWEDNRGFSPTIDDGGAGPNNQLFTWFDVLYDAGYVGNENAQFCPSRKETDPSAQARGQAWGFRYVNRFGVGEDAKLGVRTHYGINTVLTWNWRQEFFPDATRQVMIADAPWVFFGNLNAQWATAPFIGRQVDPVNTPTWMPTVAWRHGRQMLSQMVFMDGSVRLERPIIPKSIVEWRNNTVDNVRAFAWLPGEWEWMNDGDYVYGIGNTYVPGANPQPGTPREAYGEIASYWRRFPKYAGYTVNPLINPNGGDRELLSKLNAGYRTSQQLWKKLPANPNDRH